MNKIKTGRSTFIITPMNYKQLSIVYGVSRKTFAKWLEPFHAEIGEKLGGMYNVAQVKIIVEKLGMPGTVIED